MGRKELKALEKHSYNKIDMIQDYRLKPAKSPTFYKHLEKRMELEDQLLVEIQEGNLEKALEAYNQLLNMILADNEGSIGFLYVKSYSYSLNILCRRAAYQSGVPIAILHTTALEHITKINGAVSRDVLFDENIRMISKYTELIRSISLNQYSPVVNKVLEYVFMNYNQEISLKDLADYCGLTPAYLSAVFKEKSGQSVISFVTEKKMEYACALLAGTEMQIQEIAAHLGYQDVSYFTRVFRKKLSTTPTKYRSRKKQSAAADKQ